MAGGGGGGGEAKQGDEAGFTAANASLQNHGKKDSEAATELGATDCG